ncbi:radical SAM family heme chaperone HemW [Phormidesmis priestleyi]
MIKKHMEFVIPSSAYLHIPFCRRRCFYCDFPISVVGDKLKGENSGTIAHYVNVLCQEIRLTSSFGQPLKTVFFGGGTPSLLSMGQLNQILQTLDQQFGLLTETEISMEIDPGTFDFEQIQGYRSAGVNRVSLGVQAFQPELLSVCGRTHTVEDVYGAIDLIHQADIENFSLDLISGLPHQTITQWQASLEKAIALNPKHLSTYDLTIEPMTPFGKHYQPGATPLPTDETAAEMYRMAQQILTSNRYEHYEISNYAQAGYQCQHNRVYWENRSFYGFGMGATSYLQGDRVSRPRKTREYFEWVNEKVKNESLEASVPNSSEILLDTLMVGLRLAEGLSITNLIRQFGEDSFRKIWTCLQPYQKMGWVEVLGSQNQPVSIESQLPDQGRLRLTDPEGFLFSNVVLVKLFETFDEQNE